MKPLALELSEETQSNTKPSLRYGSTYGARAGGRARGELGTSGENQVGDRLTSREREVRMRRLGKRGRALDRGLCHRVQVIEYALGFEYVLRNVGDRIVEQADGAERRDARDDVQYGGELVVREIERFEAS